MSERPPQGSIDVDCDKAGASFSTVDDCGLLWLQ